MITKKMAIWIVIVLLGVGVVAIILGRDNSAPTAPANQAGSASSPLVAAGQFESPTAISEQVVESVMTSPLAPEVIPEIPGPAFAIDRPLKSGATQISGQGPVDIPILIVDVSMTGEELGQGFIDSDGNFKIDLTIPLEEGHRVGVMAGTAHPMSPAEAQVYVAQLRPWAGEEAKDLPFIGMIFDTALVEP